MRWLELATRVDSEAVEAVSEVFSRVVPGGVAIEPEGQPGADDGFVAGDHAVVRGYLPLDEHAAAKTRTLEESLWHLRAIWPVGELETREVAEEDWANAWKQHYTTFRIGRRLVIHPVWREYAAESDDVVVSLDPGAAFGTGLHPTTRRCLELLEAIVQRGDHVFDVGTGSGILAIAAAQLGADRVLAVDVDALAVRAASANVALNDLADQITVAEGSADSPLAEAAYPVVIANIIARVILALAPELVAKVRPGGTLVAAGIIADRVDEVIATFERLGLQVDCYVDGDWRALVGRRAE
ncbi:MAG TPA: 50S ribosomal protein L11 methyltransferase [Chloroflexota bacterium]|nr:50S ribosomal protein L11 methyltransferase [Chloroflexota bacterium]